MTALGFGLGSGLIGWALYHHQLFDIYPVETDTVMTAMRDAVVAVNDERLVTDTNPAADDLLSIEEPLGTPLSDTHPTEPDEDWFSAKASTHELTIDENGDQRYYLLDVTPLADDPSHRGHRLIFRDETTRRKSAANSNGRANTLNSSPARSPTTSGTLLPSPRAASNSSDASATPTAWEHVDTGDAILDIESSSTLVANEDRLTRLFENLFRNSVEHGGDIPTIRVGTLDSGGFYVEDDGPGIPEKNREEIFDRGVTTEDDGTGFGLAIVDVIVGAHDWSITVTDSETGGARFEIET